MLMKWMAGKLFGIQKGWFVFAAACALMAAGAWIIAAENADDKNNQDLGAAAQRADDLHTTLNRTETANAARAEINDSRSDARYHQCLRTARTPANCERFVPGSQTD
jgi:hypothetical protein